MRRVATLTLNLLAAGLLAATAPTALGIVWVFLNPRAPINPFPPATEHAAFAAGPSATAASLFPTFPPLWTATPLPPPTATRTPRPTARPTPTATPRPPTATVPPEATVEHVIGYAQALPLSCESRSAADWAAFFGVAIDELEFLHSLPRSDDPNVGFVGDVGGKWGLIPPDAYGVHAGPVAAQLRQHGLWAMAVAPLGWDELQREIVAGRPVIVWVVGHVERGTSAAYSPSSGQAIIVARYEHTVIVTGYSPGRVRVLDGDKTYTRSLDAFLQSWAVLGNMAVIYRAF